MKLVWKLLRQHISVPQFAGFFLANLVGMVIILLGIQFYNDTQAIYQSEDSFMKEDYLIVNKKIGAVTTITGKSNDFSDAELADAAAQPFVQKIGTFSSSSFDVRASFDIQGFARFSTDMFFESVPDEFVDVKTEDWGYVDGSPTLPIILPKDYLDLYNFGYAQSRNMPKLSEGILGALKLRIDIDGNGYKDSYDGQIVGFSSRLNTILVPQAFMDYATRRYTENGEILHTRLIMQVNNPTDDRIKTTTTRPTKTSWMLPRQHFCCASSWLWLCRWDLSSVFLPSIFSCSAFICWLKKIVPSSRIFCCLDIVQHEFHFHTSC